MSMTRRTAFRGAGARRLAPLCAAACALWASAARAADEPNPYSLGVLETISHDSNVFRAPSGPAVSSDWISTTGIVGSLDQPISRERLKASGEFDINRFRNQSQLNSTAHTLSIEGDWATVDRLSGEVGYQDTSQLYRYSLDSLQTQTAKNTLDTHSGFARFHLGVVTKLTIDAAVEGMEQTYSAPTFRYRDLNRWDASLGVAYQSSPDLRTSLSYRRTRGDYPHYLTQLDAQGQAVTTPDRFTRNDVIFGIVYAASGASRLKLNVSKAVEDHSVIGSRSFDTWAADGQWDWTPTGRTHLTFDFIRDDDTGSHDVSLFGQPLASTDATRRTAITGRLAYQLTGKITLNASGSFAKRELDTAFAAVQGANSHASDKLYQASLGLTWAAARSVQLGCNAAREHRSVYGSAAGFVTYPYDATVISCTGQFTFN
jgi:hypothetical protein